MTLEQEIKLQASYAYDDGFNVGFNNGFNDGFNDGFNNGAHDNAIETARLMIANGIKAEMVCKCTRLSIEEVTRLQAEQKQ